MFFDKEVTDLLMPTLHGTGTITRKEAEDKNDKEQSDEESDDEDYSEVTESEISDED